MIKYISLFAFIWIWNGVNTYPNKSQRSDRIITDTGFVIYTQPDFTALFVATKNKNLIDELNNSKSLKYFRTYHEDFRKFIVLNDSLPEFMRYDSTIEIFYKERLDQRSIIYFRVALTLKIPKEIKMNLGNSDDPHSDYYLKNMVSHKKFFLMEYGSPIWDVSNCIGYELLR